MVVQDRYSALQNENVRLYHIFQQNGTLVALSAAPTVTILDKDGVTTLDTITATAQSTGMYYVDWFVPVTTVVGRYYDKWTYTFTGDTSSSEVITYFEVHPQDTILNFSSSLVSNKYNNTMEKAIRELQNYLIYEVMHIPVYGEQARRTEDGLRYNFAFKNWNPDPRPLVRVNNKIEDEKWYADYNGNIFFQNAKDNSDVIYADYNFAFFSKDDLAGFVKTGLDAMNAIPPASTTYRDIASAPAEWWHGIMLYASVQALRRLLLGMTLQEVAIIFGDKEQANSSKDTFKSLYDDYFSLWKEMSAGIKKKLPQIGQISVPEYSLPGGRSRWYRYMFVSQLG